jgi:hypothetical protein
MNDKKGWKYASLFMIFGLIHLEIGIKKLNRVSIPTNLSFKSWHQTGAKNDTFFESRLAIFLRPEFEQTLNLVLFNVWHNN